MATGGEPDEIVLVYEPGVWKTEFGAILISIWIHWLHGGPVGLSVTKRNLRRLEGFYRLGLISGYQYDDDINHYFIRQRCIPYEASAKNPSLFREWKYVFFKFWKIAKYNKIPPPTTVSGRPYRRFDVHPLVSLEWGFVAHIAPIEVAREGPTTHRKIVSTPPGLAQTLQQMNLDASEGKESIENKPSVSGLSRTTSFEKPTGAISKKIAKHPQGLSVEEKGQTKNIPCPSVEQAKERTSSDSSEDEQSSEKEPSVAGIREAKSSQNIPVASSQEPTGKHSKPSSKNKRQKKKSNKKKSDSGSRKGKK